MKSKPLFLAFAACSGLAHADTTLTYHDANGQTSSVIYLSDGMSKITNQSETSTDLIFNAQTNTFTVVNHPEQSYLLFGVKEIAALSDVSAMVDKMLAEQLAQLPAGQREQMRGMMENMIKQQMPKAAPVPEYSRSGQQASHNGFACETIIKTVNGQASGDFCVTDYSALGVSTAEYQAISAFMKTAEKMAAQFGQDQSMNFASIGQVLPVYYRMGSEQAYLVAVDHGTLGAQTFQVPEGYQQQALPTEMLQ
ncbi:hypothetical protein [Marinicella meishanensis]|uniref:hypothetical protein n=1 Tax=Marinicella meishanensis TaxID=2873263 RepID=UPI001CBB427B|nr:hypothetical protein [Marinicella sp. NBU2979]